MHAPLPRFDPGPAPVEGAPETPVRPKAARADVLRPDGARSEAAPRSSRIFVRNVTILDCAVLDPARGPRGRSWHVDVAWAGKVDADGVVFDFGLAKKAAKASIDAWFDHRLLAGRSSVVEGAEPGRLTLASPFVIEGTMSEGNGATVGRFEVDTYPQAVALLDDAVIEALFGRGDARPLAQALAVRIHEEGPASVESVRVTLRENDEHPSPRYFTYTHSLRNHFGNCQRFHGHSNVVEVFDAQGGLDEAASVRAARLLDGRYLVSPAYVDGVNEPAGPDPAQARIRYSGSQGEVRISLPRQAVVILPEESSIENISRYLATALHLPLGWEVHAYEGIAKGAVASADA